MYGCRHVEVNEMMEAKKKGLLHNQDNYDR